MNRIAFFDPNSSNNTGKISGKVTFHACDKNSLTYISVQLSGFVPKTTHGFHVHQCGDLSKGCASACDHFNPFGKKHGSFQLYGSDRHVGDFLPGNLVSDENGNVNVSFLDDLVKLYGEADVTGRSVVIHLLPDDEGKFRNNTDKQGVESGKNGNAGARIACAVIGITNDDFHPKK